MFNMEADSLNATILGQKAVPGTEEFDLFIKETVKEITIKAGQKCTAVRRIIVPEDLIDEVQNGISKRLESTKIGDPSVEGVRMGALATRTQVERVSESVTELCKSQKIVYGDMENFGIITRALNSGNSRRITQALKLYVHDSNGRNEGLVNRRNAEVDLFKTPYTPPTIEELREWAKTTEPDPNRYEY